MYMLAIYFCKCGCRFQFREDTTCKELVCPNCGLHVEKSYSDAILNALHTMNEVPERLHPDAPFVMGEPSEGCVEFTTDDCLFKNRNTESF